MPRIAPAPFESFLVDLARGLGTPDDLAAKFAASLVEADLVGHSSHGSRLLPAKYTAEIAADKIDPAAEPTIERDTGVFTTVNGRKAFGQVVAREAIDAGIAAAEDAGIGVVSLRNVSHIGRVGEWAERATAAGMGLVGFVANPGSQWVAPPGSAERRFSTNPIVVGLPTFDALPFPIVLDMASSQVARSKIREPDAAAGGLPADWLIDDDGAPLTDGAAFDNEGRGAMLPLGGLATGHKGFGLAVIAELLAGNASDGSVSGTDDVLWGNHALFFVLDLERCTSRAAIEERAAAMAAYVRETEYSSDIPTPWATKGEHALLPGEAEHERRLAHRENGIPIPADDAALLRELAGELDVAVPAALS